MLRWFFTAVYFLAFLYCIDLLFRNTLSIFTDLLAVICWIIALIASVGLGSYTANKIEENYKNK